MTLTELVHAYPLVVAVAIGLAGALEPASGVRHRPAARLFPVAARRLRLRLGDDRLSRAPGVGIAAGVWAALIGVSTPYTKQHYALDVVAAAAAAFVAYALFLRRYHREGVAEIDRRVAPVRALYVAGLVVLMVAASGWCTGYRDEVSAPGQRVVPCLKTTGGTPELFSPQTRGGTETQLLRR